MNPLSRPKALLVYPRFPPSYWGFQYALELLGKRSNMPPLGLLTVAALFPPHWRLRLVDMNVGELTGADVEWADLVLTSTMVVQRRSLREVIARCNRLGRPVVVGGPHPTSFQDEIAGADHYVLGEVEETFPRFLAAWEAGAAARVVRPERKPAITSTPVPRFDLLDLEAYRSMALQFSRGCPFNCEFCDITKLFGRVPRTKSTEQMLAELDLLYELGWRRSVFLVDDNFIGNKKEALRVLPAIADWQRRRGYPFNLYTEASVNLAKIEPLMDAMVKAGFDMVFLGIESPNPVALEQTKKVQNTDRGDGDYLLHAVRAIQRKGIEVTGGFIVGLDGDGPEIFDAQVDFIQRAGIPVAMVGLLTALRGTDLHGRLEAEGRLLDESSGNNVEVSLNFRPQLDREVLVEGYRRVLARLYEPTLATYFERSWKLLSNLGRTGLPRRPAGKGEVLAVLRSLRRLLPSRRAPAYLKLLGRTLLRRPALLAEALRLGIVGLHLHRYTEQTLAVHDFRREALRGYDHVEEMAAASRAASEALRRQAEEALRRLRRFHRRLRPEFRRDLLPDWAGIHEAIQDCVRESAALELLHRTGPTLRQLFADTSWLASLKTEGYALADRWREAPSVALAVAPLLEQGRMRRSLERFFRELGVKVVTATEQMAHLGQEGLDRLARGGDAAARLLDYLRTLGGSIDTLVVPVSTDLGDGGSPTPILVAPPPAAARLPRLVCFQAGAGRRRLRESLAALGVALTGDPVRVDNALDRALALI